MDYRILQIDVEHEDTVVIPAARLDKEGGYVVLKTLTSASDPRPRVFVLRRGEYGSLNLIETTEG